MICPQCSRPNPIELEATNELRCWWCDNRWPAPAKRVEWTIFDRWPRLAKDVFMKLTCSGYDVFSVHVPDDLPAVHNISCPTGYVQVFTGQEDLKRRQVRFVSTHNGRFSNEIINLDDGPLAA